MRLLASAETNFLFVGLGLEMPVNSEVPLGYERINFSGDCLRLLGDPLFA